jgi:hypothetical protein
VLKRVEVARQKLRFGELVPLLAVIQILKDLDPITEWELVYAEVKVALSLPHIVASYHQQMVIKLHTVFK